MKRWTADKKKREARRGCSGWMGRGMSVVQKGRASSEASVKLLRLTIIAAERSQERERESQSECERQDGKEGGQQVNETERLTQRERDTGTINGRKRESEGG